MGLFQSTPTTPLKNLKEGDFFTLPAWGGLFSRKLKVVMMPPNAAHYINMVALEASTNALFVVNTCYQDEHSSVGDYYNAYCTYAVFLSASESIRYRMACYGYPTST
jgi:hypothetical protein